MIGVVLLTHAQLGQSLIEAVQLIAGEQEQVAAVGLEHGDGVEEFEEKCRSAARLVDSGSGVLAFVDFLGGTPANSLLKCMKEKTIPCVTGVNMPMLLEALISRDQFETPEKLMDMCVEIGKKGIVNLASVLEKRGGNEMINDF